MRGEEFNLQDRLPREFDGAGNPRVTPEVTRDVCLLARMMAANMYFSKMADLMFEVLAALNFRFEFLSTDIVNSDFIPGGDIPSFRACHLKSHKKIEKIWYKIYHFTNMQNQIHFYERPVALNF